MELLMPKNRISQMTIEGMDCADCAIHIEKDVRKLPGVKSARVDFMSAKLNVEFDEAINSLDDIEAVVKNAGYSAKKIGEKQKTTLIVKGMDCTDESIPIEERLKKMDGIFSIKFNLVANKLIVEHNIPLKEILKALKELGFEADLFDRAKKESHRTFWQKRKMLILTIVSGIFAVGGTAHNYLHVPDIMTVPFLLIAIIAGGYYVVKKGLKEARNFRLGMNFLMTIAVVGAIFIGEWSEAAMVVFLFALAQLLESYSLDRARNSIRSLMELAPNIALLKTKNGSKTIPVEEVNIGDMIIIKPGDRIPLDGVVCSGSSFVNQAPITGESIPVEKSIKDEVFAGTINEKGTLEVRVTKKSEDSTLSQIIHLIEEAQAQKAPSQSFVEKFARYYTPSVVVFAILLAAIPPLFFNGVFQEWLYRALVLLVISCPCALVISTPVTIVSGLTNAARSGILIKGGAYLENFSHLRVLAFDKTGTLTVGKPQVQTVIALNNHSESDLLMIAASIESRSEHPLAQAIVDYAEARNIQLKVVNDFESITGKGVRASIKGEVFYIGNHRLFEENGWCEEEIHPFLEEIEKRTHTAVVIGSERNVMGIIAIADAVRENARQAIKNLHSEGMEKTIMLTGDNQKTAEAIAREIGIDEFRAELLPQDKVVAIKELLTKHKHVAMVVDGINDAPALAAATMGISMGTSGTDTALETADIALMKDDLSKLAYLTLLSRKTIRIVKQNIYLSLIIKGVFVILAIPGLATLWMAVFADTGASLIVVFNGLRALKIGKR
jgi:Cd2+/Zn2+-exporting ATPase